MFDHETLLDGTLTARVPHILFTDHHIGAAKSRKYIQSIDFAFVFIYIVYSFMRSGVGYYCLYPRTISISLTFFGSSKYDLCLDHLWTWPSHIQITSHRRELEVLLILSLFPSISCRQGAGINLILVTHFLMFNNLAGETQKLSLLRT